MSDYYNLLEIMSNGRGCLIDTEYNNISSWDADKCWCASAVDLTTGERRNFHPKGEGVDQFHDQFKDELKEYLEGFDYYVGHFFHGAEYYILKNLIGIDIPPEKIVDTLVLSRLLRPQSPRSEYFPLFKSKGWDTRLGGHSMRAWGKRLGFPKGDFDDFAQYTHKQMEYCDNDIVVNEKMLEVLLKEINDFAFDPKCIWVEHEANRILTEQREHGFLLDKQRATKLLKETSALLEQYTAELHTVFPKVNKLKEVYTPKLKKDGTLGAAQKRKLLNNIHDDVGNGSYNIYVEEEFNAGSPKQVGERLMTLGWNPQKFTATGQPSTDKHTIQSAIDFLSKDTPEIEVLRKYGVVAHRNSMAREWMNLAEESKDGRIRGSCNHIGPWTHRGSHYAPNMGNVASVQLDDSGVPLEGLEGNFGWDSRHCWVIPEGKVLVGADASGIQLRALAHYMDDEDYIKEVCEGDVHVVNQEAAGIEGGKAGRAIAKTFIYAWLLGAGDEKIGMIIGVTPEEYPVLFEKAAKVYRKNWWSDDPSKQNLLWWVCDKLRNDERAADHKTVAVILKGAFAKQKFLNSLPALRAFREKDIKAAAKQGYMWGLDGRKIWIPSEHLAMGAYLQGFEATIMKWAMPIYQKTLRDSKIPFKQVDFIHDEFQVETYPQYADQVGQAVVDAIKEAGRLLNVRCPLDGEYKIGTSWAETH